MNVWNYSFRNKIQRNKKMNNNAINSISVRNVMHNRFFFIYRLTYIRQSINENIKYFVQDISCHVIKYTSLRKFIWFQSKTKMEKINTSVNWSNWFQRYRESKTLILFLVAQGFFLDYMLLTTIGKKLKTNKKKKLII